MTSTWELSIAQCRLIPSSLHSKLASITSSLIAGEKKRKRQVKMGERRVWNWTFRSFLKVSASANLASSIWVTQKGKGGCDVMGERNKDWFVDCIVSPDTPCKESHAFKSFQHQQILKSFPQESSTYQLVVQDRRIIGPQMTHSFSILPCTLGCILVLFFMIMPGFSFTLISHWAYIKSNRRIAG